MDGSARPLLPNERSEADIGAAVDGFSRDDYERYSGPKKTPLYHGLALSAQTPSGEIRCDQLDSPVVDALRYGLQR
jgi:hypothetical protein